MNSFLANFERVSTKINYDFTGEFSIVVMVEIFNPHKPQNEQRENQVYGCRAGPRHNRPKQLLSATRPTTLHKCLNFNIDYSFGF